MRIFSRFAPRREGWRKEAKSWGYTNGEKYVIIYTLRRIFCDFFGCFAKRMRLCGDIKGRRWRRSPIAQFNTRSSGVNAPMLPRRCRAGGTSGRLCFAARFCGCIAVHSDAFLRAYYALLCTLFAPIKPCYVPIICVKRWDYGRKMENHSSWRS